MFLSLDKEKNEKSECLCGRETPLHPHNKMTKAKAISKEEQRAIEMFDEKKKIPYCKGYREED